MTDPQQPADPHPIDPERLHPHDPLDPEDAVDPSDPALADPDAIEEPAGPLEPVDPAALAAELGALAAGVDGVTRVQARPGVAAVLHGAVDGAVGGLRSLVAGGAGRSADGPATPAGPVVGVAVSDVDVRLTLDVCVTEEATAPAVARRVSEALLAHPALAVLPPATLDLRVVAVDC